MDEWDLVSKLSPTERAVLEFRQQCICPDDGKYGKTTKDLVDYLTPQAEWKGFLKVQRTLLETRVEFGKADRSSLEELDRIMPEVSLLNASLLEDDKRINHDQLGLLQEVGRHVSPETLALLHPGTTSYDIVDTARSMLFKQAWYEKIRPQVALSIEKLCSLAECSIDILQVGRTHLQDTSPVPFGVTLAGYARRIAERVEKCDAAFDDLRGKVSGIVGTGASIDMVIGEGMAMRFQERVLEKLNLKPDYAATQIVQRERLCDVGNSLVTLMYVLDDFAEDVRKMYSSAIQEATSRDNAERLGGASADAMKNNPIQYENIAGNGAQVESGMLVLYRMIESDFQRDLRNSRLGRYQPQMMMSEVYESFVRINKALPQLSINTDKMEANLKPVRDNPSEAMVAILRGEGWVHPHYGVGHDFVKEMGKKAKKTGKPLLSVAQGDIFFAKLYANLPENKQDILHGHLEKYIGFSIEIAEMNIDYARRVVG
jgi:adenylosuccinate lyase